MPTRYNEIGLAGKPAGANDGAQRSAGKSSDPFLRQYVIDLPINADVDPQGTGFTMPAICQSMSGFLRVVGVVTGTTPDVTIGTSSSPAALLASTSLAATGIFETVQGIDLSGEEIFFEFGEADYAGGPLELVLTVLASDT